MSDELVKDVVVAWEMLATDHEGRLTGPWLLYVHVIGAADGLVIAEQHADRLAVAKHHREHQRGSATLIPAPIVVLPPQPRCVKDSAKKCFDAKKCKTVPRRISVFL